MHLVINQVLKFLERGQTLLNQNIGNRGLTLDKNSAQNLTSLSALK